MIYPNKVIQYVPSTRLPPLVYASNTTVLTFALTITLRVAIDESVDGNINISVSFKGVIPKSTVAAPFVKVT